MKFLWNDNAYKTSFIAETKAADPKSFLRFFNLMLNDATYLLDESLKVLQEMHEFQQDRADNMIWVSLGEVCAQFVPVLFNSLSNNCLFMDCSNM